MATTATAKQATKTYRVATAGITYNRLKDAIGPDGQPTVIVVQELATFGQSVELTDAEAARLKQVAEDHTAAFNLPRPVEFIKAKDAPLSYDEMSDKQLDAEVKERGIAVVSSGADDEQPLRTDKINALVTYDQGQGTAA